MCCFNSSRNREENKAANDKRNSIIVSYLLKKSLFYHLKCQINKIILVKHSLSLGGKKNLIYLIDWDYGI